MESFETMHVKIAVDFDGTIVDHKFPEIGEEKLFAFSTLKAIQKKGFKLILWTYRSGKLLDEAVEYCKQNGVEFYAVNKNYPEEIFDESMSRKVDVDIYIDDKNIGGFLGWTNIWKILNRDEQNFDEIEKNILKNSKRSIFKKRRK